MLWGVQDRAGVRGGGGYGWNGGGGGQRGTCLIACCAYWEALSLKSSQAHKLGHKAPLKQQQTPIWHNLLSQCSIELTLVDPEVRLVNYSRAEGGGQVV